MNIQPKYHAVMNEIASLIDRALNEARNPNEEKVGFMLMVFGDGHLNYISNCDRSQVIAAMLEWIERQDMTGEAGKET